MRKVQPSMRLSLSLWQLRLKEAALLTRKQWRRSDNSKNNWESLANTSTRLMNTRKESPWWSQRATSKLKDSLNSWNLRYLSLKSWDQICLNMRSNLVNQEICNPTTRNSAKHYSQKVDRLRSLDQELLNTKYKSISILNMNQRINPSRNWLRPWESPKTLKQKSYQSINSNYLNSARWMPRSPTMKDISTNLRIKFAIFSNLFLYNN